MRSSDQRVIIVFVTDSLLISTSDFLCKQLVVTSNADPILVFLRIEAFPFRLFSSLDKLYSRKATDSVNCENSSEFFVVTYCPTSIAVLDQFKIQSHDLLRK